jgi:transposase
MRIRARSSSIPKGFNTERLRVIVVGGKTAPPKQRHTAKRIFERLRIEHGFLGYTVVKDYVRLARIRSREVFVPLAHPPGHAQVDFGECIGVIGGVRMKLHVFCLDPPRSDACFVKAYPAETTEAFFNGHVSADRFSRLGQRGIWAKRCLLRQIGGQKQCHRSRPALARRGSGHRTAAPARARPVS